LLTFTDAEFARRLALEAIAVRIERLRGDQSEIRTHRRRLSHAGITASCPMCERVLTRSALLAVLDAIESQLATLEVDLSYFEQRREQLRGTT
jgi:hypothetical protein